MSKSIDAKTLAEIVATWNEIELTKVEVASKAAGLDVLVAKAVAGLGLPVSSFMLCLACGTARRKNEPECSGCLSARD